MARRIARTTANTAGTFVSDLGNVAKMDSTDGAHTVATLGHYTANPSGLGTSAGVISWNKCSMPIITSLTQGDINPNLLMDESVLAQRLILRGTSEFLVVNGNSVALPAGAASWFVNVIWTEE